MVLDQLGKIMLGDASSPRLFDSLLGARAHLFADRFPDAIHQSLHVDSVVPDLECLDERIVGHLLPVGPHGCAGRPYRIVLAQTEVTSGDDHACGKALEVPFPRRGQRLVEVIDVENHIALGRGEAAEVEQMGVATGLYSEPGDRRMGQVGRHQRRGAAIKGEW